MSRSVTLSIVFALFTAVVAFVSALTLVQYGPVPIWCVSVAIGLISGLISGIFLSAGAPNRIASLLISATLFAAPALAASTYVINEHKTAVAELRAQQNEVIAAGLVQLQVNLFKNHKSYMDKSMLTQSIKDNDSPVPVATLVHMRDHIDVIGHRDATSGEYQINFQDLLSYKDRLEVQTRNW